MLTAVDGVVDITVRALYVCAELLETVGAALINVHARVILYKRR